MLTIPDVAFPADSTAPLDTRSLFADLWQPAFPSVDLVDQAAALLPRISAGRAAVLEEGPRPYIRIGPGVVEVRSKDYARAERTAEREVHRHELDVEALCAYLDEHGTFPEDPEPVRAITEWSRKSRSRMVRTLGTLDFTPMYEDRSRLPALVTLTYPGDWLTVVPSGRVLKAHLKAFRKRYERAWGEALSCVWKLEFQSRGAPHVHMLMVPPHGKANRGAGLGFREWLSRTWAEVVDHPDQEERRKHELAGTGIDFAEGLRAADPKRIAVYFSKHATFRAKEYQHVVPEQWQEPGCTPGRFWGYWTLRPHVATVEVAQDVATRAGRTLRRWSAAQGTTREVSVPRTKGGRVRSGYAEVEGLAGARLVDAHSSTRWRRVRRPVRHMRRGRGFVMVNDGAAMGSQLARYLDPPAPDRSDPKVIAREREESFREQRLAKLAKLGLLTSVHQ